MVAQPKEELTFMSLNSSWKGLHNCSIWSNDNSEGFLPRALKRADIVASYLLKNDLWCVHFQECLEILKLKWNSASWSSIHEIMQEFSVSVKRKIPSLPAIKNWKCNNVFCRRYTPKYIKCIEMSVVGNCGPYDQVCGSTFIYKIQE